MIALCVLLGLSVLANIYTMRGWKKSNADWADTIRKWEITIVKAEALEKRLEPFRGLPRRPTAEERLQVIYYSEVT